MSVTYKLDPDTVSTFTPVMSGGSVNLTGLTDFTINESGTPVDLSVDGSPTVQAVYIDNIAVDVTINGANPAAFTGVKVGDYGTLVLNGVERIQGVATGNGLTATIINAVVVSNNPTINTGGLAGASITFRAGKATGDIGIVAWS